MELWARVPLSGEGASERAAPEADMAIEREREEKTERVAKKRRLPEASPGSSKGQSLTPRMLGPTGDG